jgi:phage regulator Rha-like protein
MEDKIFESTQSIELVIEHEQPMVSSMLVSEHFEKTHYNVLQEIHSLGGRFQTNGVN